MAFLELQEATDRGVLACLTLLLKDVSSAAAIADNGSNPSSEKTSSEDSDDIFELLYRVPLLSCT